MVEQGSEQWHQYRLGKVTGSRAADVMAKGKGGADSASRKNYMMELLCQRLTGKREEKFVTDAMARGTMLEPMARSAYEAESGLMVIEASFVFHPTIAAFGASPDGFIGDDGLLEIKCPNTAQHVDFLTTGKPDGKYIWQMHAQMLCTGRKWCDFVSFDDRMPDDLQYAKTRVYADEEKLAELETGVIKFLDELDTLELKMNQLRGNTRC